MKDTVRLQERPSVSLEVTYFLPVKKKQQQLDIEKRKHLSLISCDSCFLPRMAGSHYISITAVGALHGYSTQCPYVSMLSWKYMLILFLTDAELNSREQKTQTGS